MIDKNTSIRLVVQDLLTASSSEEICVPDSLEILKKKYFFSTTVCSTEEIYYLYHYICSLQM